MGLTFLLRPRFKHLLVAACICVTVAFCQRVSSAYQSSLATHPDEAAHFVSGVCVLDYIETAFGQHPVRFAENYYAQYPRVAFGHWPPLFFVLQAVWYGVAGVSIANAALLAGAIVASTALLLFFRLARLHGVAVAAGCAAMFLALPLVRESELMLMSDMAACLFGLLAVLAFCDASRRPGMRGWLWVAIWLGAALLTKESALSLVVVLLFAGGWIFRKSIAHSLNTRRVAVAGGIAAVLLLLYETGGLIASRGGTWLDGLRAGEGAAALIGTFVRGVSPGVLLLALFGGLARVGDGERRLHRIAALAWLAGTIGLQVVVRSAVEPRYLLPAYPAAILLAAEGLRTLRDLAVARWQTALVLACTAICVLTMPGIDVRQRIGYDAVAAAAGPDRGRRMILVAADEKGEGALIANVVAQDANRSAFVLRASKVLSSSDWVGRNYKLTYSTPDALLTWLNETSVRWIVMDSFGFLRELTRPHYRLLEETIQRHPEQFRLQRNLPLYVDGHRRDNAVQIYENLAAASPWPATLTIDVAGRAVTVDLGQPLRPVHRSATPQHFSVPLPHFPHAVTIAPGNDAVPARGGRGRIYITVPESNSWAVRNLPQWLRFSKTSGSGDALLNYEVHANRTNQRRSAVVEVAGHNFAITQPRSETTYPPFREDFSRPVIPVGALRSPDPNDTGDPPGTWVLDDPANASAVWQQGDLGGGVRGLLLQRSQPPANQWDSQLWLSRVQIEAGAKYQVSVRMKAEPAARVWLRVDGRIPPYAGCGLDQAVTVTPEWQTFVLDFKSEPNCQGSENRLLLQAGKVFGRLWISDLRFTQTDTQSIPQQ